MKTKSFLLASAILLLTSAAPNRPGEVKYSIDTGKSTVRWTGYYVFSFGSHYGTISLSKGDLYVADNEVTRGSFDIDMNSIENLDMKGDDGATSLVDHLKSDDFFSVDKFPSARFEILKMEKLKDTAPGQPNYEIMGELTVKDITKPIKFPAIVSVGSKMIKASARFKFDRTKWNIRYNSGRFFDNVGDGAISDGIGMEIEFVANKIADL